MTKWLLVVACMTLLVVTCIDMSQAQRHAAGQMVEKIEETDVTSVRDYLRLITTNQERTNHKLERLEQRIIDIETEQTRHRLIHLEEILTREQSVARFSAFSCQPDAITLTCPLNSTINVMAAVYGKDRYECGDECCPPHPIDNCQEDVQEIHESDWLRIKGTCDNKTSCDVVYLTDVVFDECSPGDEADYLRVFYDCLSGSTDHAVSFTAYATVDRSYTEQHLVQFDATFSNFGGHYQTDNSIFICPYDGVYMFSLNVLGTPWVTMNARLMFNGLATVGVWAQDTVGIYNGASTLITQHCTAGTQVWVKAAFGTGLGLRANTLSTFTGVLLQRD